MFDNDPNTWMAVGGVLFALFMLYIILTTEGLGVKFLVLLLAAGVVAALVAMGFQDFVANLVSPFTDKLNNFDIVRSVKTGKL